MQQILHGKSDTENGLRDQVLRWKERYDRVYAELEVAEKTLESERKTSTSTDSGSIEKQKRLKELNTYLGLTDVTGSGVIITVKDNMNSKFVTSSDLVHDGDLRAIINEIKNIGADAISINGQRIVPSTVISCAGAIVQINGESIGAPFVIEAIGNEGLESNLLRPGSFIDKYGDQISITVKKSDNITIKKYNGVLTNKYIKNAE
ncbi:MAG: DUF881 domain-containing protein [Clostridia bacterium]|nr:DUF881 domain-containing protein [Clostridia bacterium]